MQLEIIENRGPENLRDTLVELLKRSTDVCIAVAFATAGGLNEVLAPLQGVAGRGTARIVVGLYQSVTEPQALRTLLRLQEATKGNISVRLSREPGFHRKVYLLRKGRSLKYIIGSSNLTKEGLNSGGELNTLVSLTSTEASAKRILHCFDDEWTSRRSVPLTKSRVDAYAATRAQSAAATNLSRVELDAILGATPLHDAADRPPTTIRALWRTAIRGAAKAATVNWVSQQTTWDKRGLDWFVMKSPPRYGLGDQILVFDFSDTMAYLVEVKEFARMPVRCSDGRHFVAYRKSATAKRKLTDKFWRELRDIGITKKAAGQEKKLSESAWLELKQLVAR